MKHYIKQKQQPQISSKMIKHFFQNIKKNQHNCEAFNCEISASENIDISMRLFSGSYHKSIKLKFKNKVYLVFFQQKRHNLLE